jgi:hypothetical protein
MSRKFLSSARLLTVLSNAITTRACKKRGYGFTRLRADHHKEVISADLCVFMSGSNQSFHSAGQTAPKRTPQHGGPGDFTETTEKEVLGSEVSACFLHALRLRCGLRRPCVEISFLCVPRRSSVFGVQLLHGRVRHPNAGPIEASDCRSKMARKRQKTAENEAKSRENGRKMTQSPRRRTIFPGRDQDHARHAHN